MKIRHSLSLVIALAAILLAGVPASQAKEKPKEKDKDKGPKIHEVGKGLNLKGELNEKDKKDRVQKEMFAKVYLVKLVKGKTYQIDMKSTEFDCWLRLEDAKSRQLADDDDSGGGTDAQIVFTPTDDGVYRIITTSFGPEEKGAFDLSVVEK